MNLPLWGWPLALRELTATGLLCALASWLALRPPRQPQPLAAKAGASVAVRPGRPRFDQGEETMKKTALTALAVAASFALASAHAHQVWIEHDAQGAKLYFGEFGENLREASPGSLDKFVAPVAQRLKGASAEAVQVTKTPNGFALASRVIRGESLIAEEPAYPAWETTRDGKTTRGIYVPAARLVTELVKHEPRLTLDLVPTGTNSAGSTEVQAFYKGQPLAKAKVAVVTASGWAQEHRTDDAGRMTVSLPWRGTYVLELSHTDTAGGTRGADKWDRASYVTSLTVMLADGLPALPPSPPATPAPAK